MNASSIWCPAVEHTLAEETYFQQNGCSELGTVLTLPDSDKLLRSYPVVEAARYHAVQKLGEFFLEVVVPHLGCRKRGASKHFETWLFSRKTAACLSDDPPVTSKKHRKKQKHGKAKSAKPQSTQVDSDPILPTGICLSHQRYKLSLSRARALSPTRFLSSSHTVPTIIHIGHIAMSDPPLLAKLVKNGVEHNTAVDVCRRSFSHSLSHSPTLSNKITVATY